MLADLLMIEHSPAKSAQRFKILANLMIHHFGMEEELMAMAKFPGLDGHREAHAKMFRDLHAISAQISAGAVYSPKDHNRIREIVEDHTSVQDGYLFDYIEQKTSGGTE